MLLFLEEVLKIGAILLASSFKILFGVSLSLMSGYNFIETVLICSAGGISGVFVFSFFSEWLIKIWFRFFPVNEKKREKIFTKRNRTIVNVRSKFGLSGIALIAPNLTIPVGIFVMTRYFRNRKKVIIYASASVVFWTVVTASVRLIFPRFFELWNTYL